MMEKSFLNKVIYLAICVNLCRAFGIKQCADYQTHFEKILGYRPAALPVLSTTYGANFEEKILYKSYERIPSVINLQCMELCKNDHNCESYVLNFNRSECYSFTSNERLLQGVHNYRRLDDHELVEDINAVYFVKTCLNIPLSCKNTLWPLLRIPGASLIGRGYLTINKLVTRRACIERCLFETNFKCRSVSFQVSQRNNVKRLGLENILNIDVMGRCIMSREDKNMEPDAFRVAPISDEYIENNCQVVKNGADEQFLDDLCAYEHFPESALIYAEQQYIGLTDRECQEKCFKETKFFCKGLTFQRSDRFDNSRCFIHSEDVISIGPRNVIPMPNSYYMKRVQCLNLSVRCTQDDMIIRYNPRQFFQGRMYAENHPEKCAVSGTNHGPTFLTLPIGAQEKEQRCGINRAFDFETPNRTLIFVYIIIQSNPLVMMQSDRYIKVGCILNNNIRKNADGMPDYVSLETTVDFNGKDYDGSGSLVIDDGADIPKLNVYILDPIENVRVKEARIGQVLKFVIAMESHYENYGLRAVNLTATSEFDRLELISPTGCPVNSAIFPAMQKEKLEKSKIIYTKFKAFKFSSSPQVKFSVAIQFCYNSCKPINCGGGIISYGRKKRETDAAIVNNSGASSLPRIIFPDESTTAAPLEPVKFPGPVQEKLVDEEKSPGMKVDSFGNPQGVQQYFGGLNDDENRVSKVVTVPIDITLNILDSNVNGSVDRLVIAENDQIIIAGLASSHTLCLDDSLLIAILIFWAIFQVLIFLGCCIMVNRYRKYSNYNDDTSSFNNNSMFYPDSLESNRHVRFADNRPQEMYFS